MLSTISGIKVSSEVVVIQADDDRYLYYQVVKNQKVMIVVIEGVVTVDTVSGSTTRVSNHIVPDINFWVSSCGAKAIFVVTIIDVKKSSDIKVKKPECTIGIIVDKSNATRGKETILPPTPYLKTQKK